LPDLLECRLVRRRVVLDGDLGRHPAHRVCAPAVTGLYQEIHIRLEEVTVHRHAGAVGEDAIWALPELLDEAENVVPAPAVEAGGVVLQLVQNLVHLERGENRLDQDRSADRAARDAKLVLREVEDAIPEARLEVALELGQVEVGSRALRDQRRGVVKEEEPEIEEGCGNRAPVDRYVLL